MGSGGRAGPRIGSAETHKSAGGWIGPHVVIGAAMFVQNDLGSFGEMGRTRYRISS
jgi:hypothetical protein